LLVLYLRLASPVSSVLLARQAVYERLQHARTEAGPETPPRSLGELLARAIIDNLYKFIVPAIAGPARLVPLVALDRCVVIERALCRTRTGDPLLTMEVLYQLS
jgi:hypothetical protein